MKSRADGKRLLTAAGISLAVHLAGIVILGMWSLKSPPVPARIPPLAVFLEPEVVPQPVIKKPENLPAVIPAAEKKVHPARKVSKPVSRLAPKAAPSPVAIPAKPLPASSPPEQTSVKGPDTNMKTTPDSSEQLTAVKPNPLPKPKGSKIVYADTSDTGKTADTPAPTAESSPSVISSAELNAFTASLQKEGTSSEESPHPPEVTDKTAGPAGVPLPDTVSLALGDFSNTRKPVAKLTLNIPEEMLRKIEHDSFLTATFTLTPDGYILDPKVLVSQVSPQIEARVLEALRKWEFNRGSSADGNVEGQITIRFKVK